MAANVADLFNGVTQTSVCDIKEWIATPLDSQGRLVTSSPLYNKYNQQSLQTVMAKLTINSEEAESEISIKHSFRIRVYLSAVSTDPAAWLHP